MKVLWTFCSSLRQGREDKRLKLKEFRPFTLPIHCNGHFETPNWQWFIFAETRIQ